MSAISSKSVNPPVAVSGVSYQYPASGPIPLGATDLGFQYRVTTGAVVTPISGASQTQLYLEVGAVGSGVPAGTYIVFGDAVVDSITGDLNSFIRILDSATGLTTLSQSASFYQGALAQYQSLSPSFVFTATQDVIIKLLLNTGPAGGTGTPIDAGSLQVVRIA
jgi:hypothetical protein